MMTRRLLSEQHKVLEATSSVLSARKLAVTFGASTAMCENSLSVLKNVFTEQLTTLVKPSSCILDSSGTSQRNFAQNRQTLL